jgi:hypothetical protein
LIQDILVEKAVECERLARHRVVPAIRMKRMGMPPQMRYSREECGARRSNEI